MDADVALSPGMLKKNLEESPQWRVARSGAKFGAIFSQVTADLHWYRNMFSQELQCSFLVEGLRV